SGTKPKCTFVKVVFIRATKIVFILMRSGIEFIMSAGKKGRNRIIIHIRSRIEYVLFGIAPFGILITGSNSAFQLRGDFISDKWRNSKTEITIATKSQTNSTADTPFGSFLRK